MKEKIAKIRLIDIAEKLGISATAVSLAINNRPGVSQEIRDKVLKSCDELGYKISVQPNNNARIIKLYIYKKHGLVVSDTPFFSELLEGIEQEAKKYGYNAMFAYFDEAKEPYSNFEAMINSQDASGVILLATEMHKDDLAPLLKSKNPFVILDAYFNGVQANTVLIDNLSGTYEVTEHLIKCGHKNIGHLKSAIFINNFTERDIGYKTALAQNGIAFNKAYEFLVGSTLDSSYRDMLNLLEEKRSLPTAFVADNDIIAMGAMKAMQEKNIKIPEEVSIIGFDDMPNCELIIPNLTTVRVRKRNMGKLAVDQLIKQIECNEEGYIISRIGTEIVIRNSVKTITEQ